MTPPRTAPPPASLPPYEERGLHRFRIGAGFGLAAGFVTIVVPFVFLGLAAYNPGGIFTFNPTLLQYANWFVIAGALLFILSLMMYRWGFSALRTLDPRFNAAVILCWIGSVGFLLVLVIASYFLGSMNSVIACVHGQPTLALSCLNSLSPLGAATAVIGFWLAWIGSLGLVAGLLLGGARLPSGLFIAGGILYALFLVVLIVPFASMLTQVPAVQYVLVLAPFFVILAPAFVLGGARRADSAVPPG